MLPVFLTLSISLRSEYSASQLILM